MTNLDYRFWFIHGLFYIFKQACTNTSKTLVLFFIISKCKLQKGVKLSQWPYLGGQSDALDCPRSSWVMEDHGRHHVEEPLECK